MARIIIGVDGSERSEDALAFGHMLAKASATPVTVATVYPSPIATGYHGSREYDDFMREDAEGTLAGHVETLGDLVDLDARAIGDLSPARALQHLAGEQDASLIVLGSSRTGALGRVFPGSTAERLLHGAPCAVAVVPHGFRTKADHRPQAIACAWDGTPTSDVALATAEDLAYVTSASLRVVRVHDAEFSAYPPALGPGYVELLKGMSEHARAGLEERATHLAESIGAETVFVEGDAARALLQVCDEVDLMVVGSRGFGPLRAVLLGGVSGKVIREAACPVIVVPLGTSSSPASSSRPSRVSKHDRRIARSEPRLQTEEKG
jgi:nucleotide-binding universal stress UspA family protein